MARNTSARTVTAVHQQHVIASYSGPLPPAREMQALAMIDPDFPERLIRMAEKEQDFRHHYNMALGIRVQYLTVAVAFGGLTASVLIAFSGSTLASSAVAVSTIVTAALAGIFGRIKYQ